ncbi:enoyl-CoA hydratase [Bowmanella sp. JS7-9]|uniref:Enoyl-CoA hydratase n=1 Tax=Pseudobowmanella zhangzhouensis TaxID=1537679 RepID=A0ABW1XL44_9ALTE|nr:enoyl-CoA hydratase [Bowmanella sp. JS7-9]TBX20314.1 enoyl-CoA hydratase [Bowmanella sp. JS7-9]
MSLVITQFQDAIARISLNRPEKKNSLNQAMYQALDDALIQAIDDDSIKVICLQSASADFTAGNDLVDFANLQKNTSLASTVGFMRTLMFCPKPVVAKVEGLAIGIGTTLLLHCDFVYAAENAQFLLPFVNLALVPEYASSLLLPAVAGHRKAAQWLMLGEPFGAAEAHENGIISQVLPSDSLQAEVDKLLHKLASKPRQALMQTKALMKPDIDAVAEHMDAELDVFFEQLQSEAAKEAFAAFLEKRRPDPARFN